MQVQFCRIPPVPVVHFRGTLGCLLAARASLHVSSLSLTRGYCVVFVSFRAELQSLLDWTISGFKSFKLLSFTLLTQLSLLFGFQSLLFVLHKLLLSFLLLFAGNLFLKRLSLPFLFLTLLSETFKLFHKSVFLSAEVFLNGLILHTVHQQVIPFKYRLINKYGRRRRLFF